MIEGGGTNKHVMDHVYVTMRAHAHARVASAIALTTYVGKDRMLYCILELKGTTILYHRPYAALLTTRARSWRAMGGASAQCNRVRVRSSCRRGVRARARSFKSTARAKPGRELYKQQQLCR